MNRPIKDFHDYVMLDVLGHIDNITSKAMFGGYGLYLDGVIFGFITEVDELRFKANDETKEKYEALCGQQFIYQTQKNGVKKSVGLPYWQVPEEIMEDREQIADWVYEAASLSKNK